jgi:hypothetical protein
VKPRPLLAFQITAVALTVAMVVVSVAAVWLDKGVRFFAWREALGPLCILVSVFDVIASAWTITWERNAAVEKFGDREGGKR